MGDSREKLAEIALLGRYAKTRRNDFSPSVPCRWEPLTVENPENGSPFSDASAWELICKLLDEHPESFREIRLDKPPGQFAYWTVITLGPPNVPVYIKVQLFQGKAYGRSFHISTKE